MIYRRQMAGSRVQFFVGEANVNELYDHIYIYLSIYTKQKHNYKGTFGILNENYDWNGNLYY